MLKPASEMSVDELRAEVAKYELQRAKRRAYSKAHRKAMTPELKAKLKTYNKQRRAHQREVLARAAEEGVGANGNGGTVQAVPVLAAKPGKPKPSKARRTA